MEKVYLDYSATTFVDDAVLEAMYPYFKQHFGNPSAVYASGREAKAVVENARQTIANMLNTRFKNEIYFTACGTESDNWAIKGAALANANKGKHIITTSTEHHAVMDTCAFLEKQGYEVTYLPVDEYGMVSPDDVQKAIRPDTILISVIFANNEVGTINPIPEIAKVAHEHGVLFHTDAVQAAGHIPIDVMNMDIDMLSLSAHKFYGPKGIGVLYIKNGCKVEKFMHGGAQERKRRAGTENVPEIVGMAKALELSCKNMQKEIKRLSELRDYMIDELKATVPHIHLNGHPTRSLPGHVNVSLEYIEAEASLLSLDLAGIECSSGSACASGSLEASHVLLAMGIPTEIAKGALRFTMGKTTTKEQIDYTVAEIVKLSERLRKISPLFIQKEGEKKYV